MVIDINGIEPQLQWEGECFICFALHPT
jgi:hypothetical protein